MKQFKKKRNSERSLIFLSTYLPKGKKGMEMWQLVMIVLALLLLFFIIAWYAGLNEHIGTLLDRLGNLL